MTEGRKQAVCTVVAFMRGCPVPPKGMAQTIVAALESYRFEPWRSIHGKRIITWSFK